MQRTAIVVVAVLAAACGSRPPDLPADDAALPEADAQGSPDAPGPGGSGDPFAALQALPGMCSADGWCWQQPTPHGNDYDHVFATGPDNIWLTAWGTIMQWDGSAWRFHHPPADPPAQFPMSISGTGPTNMWLIYGNTLQQWDGAAWTIHDEVGGLVNFNDVWVAPDTGDAWVTQNNGIVKRWHAGTAQVFQPCSCFLGSIWGTSSTEVFITTLPPGILRFDGTRFSSTYSGPKIVGGYSGVAGDVWVSGGEGDLMRWTGTAWTPVALPPEIGRRWIQPIGHVASDDIWWYVLSPGGGFLHWDGTALTFTPRSAPDGSNLPFISGAIVDGRFWLVGRYGVVYTTSAPTVLSPVINPELAGLGAITSMWGSADYDMYFAMGSELRHWDGILMKTVPLDLPEWRQIISVRGIRNDIVNELFVGAIERGTDGKFTSVALHFDGAAWTKTPLQTGPTLGSIGSIGHLFVMGPGEAMGVGLNGFAVHYTSGQWKPVATGTTQLLTGVFGPDPDHLWVSGLQGTVLRWERANPTVMTPDSTLPTTRDLGPIHGAAGTTWIASAATSTIWRNAGSGWVELPAVTTGSYSGGLLVVDANDILTAPSTGYMMSRWDGAGWVPEDNACVVGTPRLFKPAGGSTWAAGTRGIVRRAD